MAKSPLHGRRIHIAGSIDKNPLVASAEEAAHARDLVTQLVKALVKKGANFVIPADAEPLRESDGLPICFDWAIWKALSDNLTSRPSTVAGPFAVAVQHYKNEEQIPPEYVELWDNLRSGPLVEVENAAHWNMASKRMEAQARHGDILITLGGTEGVLYLANLYHAAGKPVIPLNFELCSEATGSRRLYSYGLTSRQAPRLFRTLGEHSPHAWINRIRFPKRQGLAERVEVLVDLLEDLEPPRAFAVRLLNPDLPEFKAVEDYFETVVKPIIEDELGYRLIVIDGQQGFDHARVDEEIFAKLHRSSVVLADLTASRPNCFLELGYALGRSLPTMVMAQKGTSLPFDITTLSGHLWDANGTLKERKDAFRTHWNAIRNRPPLVPSEPLIS
jgi:TIR- and PNP-associating SLOG family